MNVSLRQGMLLVALYATGTCACAQENVAGSKALHSMDSVFTMNSTPCPVDSIWFAQLLNAIEHLTPPNYMYRSYDSAYGLWVQPTDRSFDTVGWMSVSDQIALLETALRIARELEAKERRMQLNPAER